MSTPLRALIVEDSADDAQLLLAELQCGGYDVTWERVETAEAMRVALHRQRWDIVIADYQLPHFSGPAALELLKASGKGLPFIIVSGKIGEDQAVAAMKAGAHDYLVKGRLARLVPAVERELHEAVEWRARREAEAAVRASEEKYRRLFESSQDAIMILEPPSWKFTSGNPATLKMFGAKNEREFTSREPWELSPERQPDGCASAEKAKEMIEMAVRKGSHFFEWTYRRIGGEEFPTDVLLTRMGQGEKMVVQANIRDITERKQAEGKAREQATLLDTANDAIYVTALDCTIRYWNRGAERTYGWTSAEVLNRKTTELISPDLAATEALVTGLLKQGSWSGERRQITKSGKMLEVFSRLTLVRNEQGQPQAVFAINTDITEKKQLEAHFLRAQRLESIGELASGIAHDLNNVLSPIVMAAQLLQQSGQKAEEPRLLSIIETSALRGAELITKVLTFARGIEGERVPLQPSHLLKEMAMIVSETLPKNIQIKSEMAQELWPILGDATQLNQALMNLCVNARDAMPAGGTLTLGALNVEINEAFNVTTDETFGWTTPDVRPGPYVCLRVVDTGTGIPRENLDKIFEPFFTTKAPGKGTGLGLSTVLSITRNHRGSIRIKSGENNGTCFELYFPATPAAHVAAILAGDLEVPRGQGQLILIVDDEAAVREVAQRLLVEHGYKVMTATDGNEATKIFVQHHAAIDAVITDMAMPGMDGPALVRILQQLEPDVPIIGMSGLGEKVEANSSTSWEPPMFLNKPFTRAKLLLVLHELLRASRKDARMGRRRVAASN
jgi:PAS domain S-box-containing protein